MLKSITLHNPAHTHIKNSRPFKLPKLPKLHTNSIMVYTKEVTKAGGHRTGNPTNKENNKGEEREVRTKQNVLGSSKWGWGEKGECSIKGRTGIKNNTNSKNNIKNNNSINNQNNTNQGHGDREREREREGVRDNWCREMEGDRERGDIGNGDNRVSSITDCSGLGMAGRM